MVADPLLIRVRPRSAAANHWTLPTTTVTESHRGLLLFSTSGLHAHQQWRVGICHVVSWVPTNQHPRSHVSSQEVRLRGFSCSHTCEIRRPNSSPHHEWFRVLTVSHRSMMSYHFQRVPYSTHAPWLGARRSKWRSGHSTGIWGRDGGNN